MIRFSVALGQLGWALTHWWNRQDQFEWFGRYLADRQLVEPTRILLALSAAIVSLVPIVFLIDANLHPGPGHVAAGIVAATLGVAMSLMWLLMPWPTAARSRMWVVGSDIAIALGCLAQAERIGGLTGCALFGLIGGYIAFFHGARLLAGHIAFTAAVAGVVAGLLLNDDQGSVSTVAVGVVQALLVGIALPVATQFVLEVLASDAAASEVDTLTGVLNRRGLERALERIMTIDRQNAHGLAVLVADLDNFKEINDEYGHRYGDRVLAEIAARLRVAVGSSGVVARIGGDEFVVADSLRWSEPERLATHVLHTISAASDPAVTASVGVVHLSGKIPVHHALMSTAQFTDLADAAMYAAKRAGGNTVRMRSHHYGPQ